MEEEWRLYLKNNDEELYNQMLSSVSWAAQWRDDKIEACEVRIEELLTFMNRLAESHSKLSQAEFNRNPTINDSSPIFQIECEYLAIKDTEVE